MRLLTSVWDLHLLKCYDQKQTMKLETYHLNSCFKLLTVMLQIT